MNHSLRFSRCRVPVALTWNVGAANYRLTPWPEVQLERRYDTEWVAVPPSADVLRAGGAAVRGAAWRAYLEFVPMAERECVGLYRTNRLVALYVAARCPELVGAIEETPALAIFVCHHAVLRGEVFARWHEVNAVFERSGVFGVLEWLGLPASKQALAILRNVVAADLSPALLESLRATLWRPHGVFALAQLTAITDRDLSDACALAA